MYRTLAYLLSILLIIIGAAAVRSATAQDGTPYPGQATQANVWVRNQGDAEAIPVIVRNVATPSPVAVEVVGISTVTVDPRSVVQARIVRPTWEYRQLNIAAGQNPVGALNGAGAEGWETTGIAFPSAGGATTIVLKRAN